jgi:hypothetical protein
VNFNPAQRPKAPATASLPDGQEGQPHDQRGPGFVALWIIVTGLWTVSTVLRMQRVWVPIMGWPAVAGSVYTWVSLFLPPWMFAIILLAMKRIAVARRQPDR